MTQYVYLIFDDFSEMPVFCQATSMGPDEFVLNLNRQNMNEPIKNSDTMSIRLVGQFDGDIGKGCPFEKVGDFTQSIKMLNAKKEVLSNAAKVGS